MKVFPAHLWRRRSSSSNRGIFVTWLRAPRDGNTDTLENEFHYELAILVCRSKAYDIAVVASDFSGEFGELNASQKC